MSAAALVMLLVCIAAPCALAAWFERRLSATEDRLVATEDALEDSVLETGDVRLQLAACADARAFLSASLDACAKRGKVARTQVRDLRRSLADVTAERDALRNELARPVPMAPDAARDVIFAVAVRHSLGPIASTFGAWFPITLRRDAQTLPVPVVFVTRWGSA